MAWAGDLIRMAKKETTAKVASTKSTAKEASAAPIKKSVAVVTITDIGDHLASTFDIPKSHDKI